METERKNTWARLARNPINNDFGHPFWKLV
jgi:hypothetical protein